MAPSKREAATAYVRELHEDKNSVVSLSIFRTPREQKLDAKNRREGWPHATLGSVYIGAIGRRWQPGCYEKAVVMKEYADAQGMLCWLEEQSEYHGSFPLPDISGMRDDAILKALSGGFEWVCFIDNDVEVPPDLLSRFTQYGLPIVAPLMLDRIKPKTNGRS